MGMKSELRRRLSKTEGRLRREGRRLASVFLCGALIVGNLSAVPVSVLADDDNDYTYEIEKTALQEALQTAISEGNTVNEELEFAGEHAEEYAELFEADGTLYELELSDEEIDEDDDRDKALDLRIFARIEGDIPVDEAYEIDGSEEIVFLVSNKTEKTATATISVDGLETDVITILPVDSIAVEEESAAVENAAVSTAVSSGVSVGGSGSGGSGGSAGGSAATIEETESAEEELVIEITNAEDTNGTETGSIGEDSSVEILDNEDSAKINEDNANVSAAEEEKDSSEQTEAKDPAGNAEDGNTGIEEDDTKDTDSNVSDADAEDADGRDSDAAAGDAKTENAGAETDDNKSENNADNDSDAADTESDDTSDAGNTDSGNDGVSDESGNDDSTDNAGTSDDNDSSDISEDSEVSVLGSAISIHNSVLLAASIATDSDADEEASASDADNAVDGIAYESVRFGEKGAAAFVTTAADLKLEEIEGTESEETVEYIAKADGVSVTVMAPEGALPEDAVLSVTVYEEDSYEYAAAAEAIDYTAEETAAVDADVDSSEDAVETASEDSTSDTSTASTGLAVLDISFLVDGEEVEPIEAVTVSIDASGIVPEEADASTIEVQHLTESGDGLEATLVADATDATNGTVDTDAVTAEFEVESFSTFTVTWTYGPGNNKNTAGFDVTVYIGTVEYTGSIEDISSELQGMNSSGSVDLSTLLTDYVFDHAEVTYSTSSSSNQTTSIATAISFTDGGNDGSYYTITTTSGTIEKVTSISSVKVYYKTNGPSVSISAVKTDTGYSLTAVPSNFSGDDIIYTWTVDDTNVATIDQDGQLTWANDVSSGDSVTVTVMASSTADDGTQETAKATYTLYYGIVTVTINTTYGNNNTSTGEGANVALLDANGNIVASGTTDSNGNVVFYVVPGTYTIEATYYITSSSSGQFGQSSTTGYSYSGSLEVEETTNKEINLTQDTYNAYDHVDIRVSGTYSLSVETASGTVEEDLNTYAYSGSEFSVTLPDGTVLSGSAEYSGTEVEYRITGQTISSDWDNSNDYKKFSINASILISLSELREAGLSDSEIESIFGVSLADGSSDLVTYSSTTYGVPAGTYIIVKVTDYHPTANKCNGTAGKDRGYDFEINMSSALTYLTDQLMVYKYVINENGEVISDNTSFTFTLTKSDDSSVNKTTSLVSGGSNVFSDIEAGYYYITETASEGYVPVTLNSDGTLSETGYVQYIQSETKTSGSIPSVTFYNLKLTTLGAVKLEKEVNDGNADGNYSDGTFTFRLFTDNGDETYTASSLNDITVTTSESSEFYLAAGTYTIIELGSTLESGDSQTATITVDGEETTLIRKVAVEGNPYELEDGTIYYEGSITVNKGTSLTYTVTNTYTSGTGVELPETGGPGTTPFRIAGLLLTGCSAYLLYETLKRRRNYLR